MYWLENFIEIILFEKFCEHKMIWQKLFDASSSSLSKLREYRLLQMESGEMLPLYLGVKRKLLFHSTALLILFSTDPGKHLESREETGIIVIY